MMKECLMMRARSQNKDIKQGQLDLYAIFDQLF